MSTVNDSVMDTIHVWIGNLSISAEEFNQYFAINEADKDAGVGASQFDKDIHIEWYDDDLIGVYYQRENNSLDDAIEEIPTASADVEEQIRNRCAELGITEANAMFYYTDSDLRITDTAKQYNGLTYVGAFNNS
jgi:hypothetical protein